MSTGRIVDTSEAEVANRPPRKPRSVAETLRIVEETFEPGASVARGRGVNANQVFAWRLPYQQVTPTTGSAN